MNGISEIAAATTITMSHLLRTCLGGKFDQLNPLVRQAHTGSTRLEGEARVERGNFLARIICSFLTLPPARERCRLVVLAEHHPDSMTWNRRFDGFPMNSKFHRDGFNLVERLGPIRMIMNVDVRDGALTYSLASATVCGMLEPLLHRLVLIGGCATSLLITDTAAADARATLDVDLIVDALSRGEYGKFEAEVRQLGFRPSTTNDVICRWQQNGYTVDIMPADEAFFDTLAWHLPPDEASQARLPTLIEKLAAIAGMSL